MLGKILNKMAMSELNAAGTALSSLKAGPVEQARVAAGHMLGRAAGGALIGAGVNGYEYSQTGTGIGGAFSMGESLVTGAMGGALVGAGVGALGAKKAAQSVTASAAKAQRRFDKAVAVADKRGLTGSPNRPVSGPKINLLNGKSSPAVVPRGRIEPTVPAINPQPTVANVPHAQGNMNTATANAPKGKRGKRGKK